MTTKTAEQEAREKHIGLFTTERDLLAYDAGKEDGYQQALEEVISYVDEFPSGDVIHIRSATLEFLRSLRAKGGA